MKTKRAQEKIDAVAAAVQKDAWLNGTDFSLALGLTKTTVCTILQDSLGLVKMSVQWAPKLLSKEQKEENMRICTEFIAAVSRCSMVMLDYSMKIDETIMCCHTPETKEQSKQ